MAMISKIREKNTLLLIIIVIAMLLFLIPYDAILSYFQKSEVGSVNGKDISISEWNQSNQARENTNLNYGTGRENAVWNDIKEKMILGDDFEDLGIEVSDEEYNDITIYNNPSAFVKQTFKGQNSDYVGNYEYHVSTIQKGSNGYGALKDLIVSKRKREKWDKLVSKGMYANTLDAKYDYLSKNQKRTVDFIFMDYASIPDDTIKISDSEIKAYYNAHKNDPEFQVTNPSRDLKYVEFKIDPSATDIAKLSGDLKAIKTDWETNENDTTFLRLYNTSVQSNPYIAETYPGVENDRILSDSIGSIVGPFETTAGQGANLISNMSLVKIVDRMMVPDSAKVRHILIKADNVTSQAEVIALRAKADSIMDLIKTGQETFVDMVNKFTDDPGSKDKGGDYGWFKEDASYVQPYKDFAFERTTGDIDMVNSQFGFHIMEVVDQSPKENSRTRIVVLNKPIVASDATIKSFYKDADSFATAATNDFEIAADTLGFSILEAKNVFRTNTRVGSIQNGSELINFAYGSKAKIGQVSQPIMIDGKYYVAKLDKIRPVGTPKFENIEEEMKKGAINEKKAERFVKLLDQDTLEAIETATGTRRKSATVALTQNTMPNSGSTTPDPEVVGFCFGINEGEMSAPIVGKAGVYVIAPKAMKEAPAKEDYIQEQETLITKFQQNAGTTIFSAMDKKADTKDERYTE